MRQTPVDDYLEEISTKLPEELYGRLSDAIYETVCDFDEEVEQLKDENAKLVDVLHEVEQEAIYAYNCLQQDCEAVVGGQTHFFNKWWHAECECDRAKSQNAKLTNLAKWMYQVMDMSCAVRHPYEPAPVSIQALKRAEKELQALGIEVPE